MEKWLVEGYRSVNFEDPRTKNRVEGYTLFLSRVPENDNIKGRECQKLFFASAYCDYQPAVGDEIGIMFNRYGKVDNITVV